MSFANSLHAPTQYSEYNERLNFKFDYNIITTQLLHHSLSTKYFVTTN